MEERNFYEGRVFRPPAEANSLIVQTTIGCSHNACTYCSMYRDEKFRIKPLPDVLEDFNYARKYIRYVPSVFLADGDALVRKTSDQLTILNHIREIMPECKKVSCFVYPRNILTKTQQEMNEIAKAGMTHVYMGLESGDDEILRRANKCVTAEEIYRASMMVKEAGIELSSAAIIGLGGMDRWRENAIKTAELVNRIRPDILTVNMLMLKKSTPMRDDWMRGDFQMGTPLEMIQEERLLMEHLDTEGTWFTGMHVSNYVPMEGWLNKDIPRFLHRIDQALRGEIRLTPEWMRGG